MPNWCMNNMTITHSDPAKLQEFCDAYNSGGVCNHFIPTPKDIGDGWHEWNVSNWGTKWDFGKDEHDDPAQIVNNEVSISFSTAWSPPIDFYQYLNDEHDYSIKATYWEPGMGFCGAYKDGVEDTIEYEDHKEIPNGLWDQFGMADFFEEFD